MDIEDKHFVQRQLLYSCIKVLYPELKYIIDRINWLEIDHKWREIVYFNCFNGYIRGIAYSGNSYYVYDYNSDISPSKNYPETGDIYHYNLTLIEAIEIFESILVREGMI